MSSSPESKFQASSLRLIASAIAVAALLALPSGAGAATVVNGDFEAGNLSGWEKVDSILEPPFGGSWYAYSGTTAPGPIPVEVQAPPQGNFAATSFQEGPGSHILYQDVALEPGRTQVLSMLVYYDSNYPIKSPDSLSDEEGENQQYRVDVIRPSSPIFSVAPADILSTVFRTVEGDPLELAPRSVAVDLSQFAGQTVRIRLAEVDNKGPFLAGADAVSIATGPPPPPSNAFSIGKLKLNKKKGTGQLTVSLPGAGTLTAMDAKKKKKAVIKKTSVTAAAAGAAKLNLKPTGVGKKKLKKAGKLSFKLNVTFTPAGGTAATQQFKGKLKLTLKKKK
jgi:hypothetical protein